MKPLMDFIAAHKV